MHRVLAGRWAGFEGQDFAANSAAPNIDYGTMHLWVSVPHHYHRHCRRHRHWHRNQSPQSLAPPLGKQSNVIPFFGAVTQEKQEVENSPT